MGLVAEMSASLEQVAHGEIRQKPLSFLRLSLGERVRGRRTGHRSGALKQEP